MSSSSSSAQESKFAEFGTVVLSRLAGNAGIHILRLGTQTDDNEHRLTRKMLENLHEALTAVEQQLEAKSGSSFALIITSTGKFFSNGLDFASAGSSEADVRSFVRDRFSVSASNSHSSPIPLTFSFFARLSCIKGFWPDCCVSRAPLCVPLTATALLARYSLRWLVMPEWRERIRRCSFCPSCS